ncbi:MAG: hypothetical protein WD847_11600 [Pirellulales bacterium]
MIDRGFKRLEAARQVPEIETLGAHLIGWGKGTQLIPSLPRAAGQRRFTEPPDGERLADARRAIRTGTAARPLFSRLLLLRSLDPLRQEADSTSPSAPARRRTRMLARTAIGVHDRPRDPVGRIEKRPLRPADAEQTTACPTTGIEQAARFIP